jgi:hypothetical protein
MFKNPGGDSPYQRKLIFEANEQFELSSSRLRVSWKFGKRGGGTETSILGDADVNFRPKSLETENLEDACQNIPQVVGGISFSVDWNSRVKIWQRFQNQFVSDAVFGSE